MLHHNHTFEISTVRLRSRVKESVLLVERERAKVRDLFSKWSQADDSIDKHMDKMAFLAEIPAITIMVAMSRLICQSATGWKLYIRKTVSKLNLSPGFAQEVWIVVIKTGYQSTTYWRDSCSFEKSWPILAFLVIFFCNLNQHLLKFKT